MDPGDDHPGELCPYKLDEIVVAETSEDMHFPR
jgi:hypothetical protein